MDTEKMAKAIEKDAGQKLPGLRDSIKQMKAGTGKVHTPEQILMRRARKATGLSQPDFAALISTPVATLRDWEQGRFVPPGSAITLAKIAAKDPNIVRKASASTGI